MANTLLLVVYYAVPAFITCFVLYVLYQIFFHPLRSYPGPFTAKLWDIYNAYPAYNQDAHLIARQNQLKYGPVIRHGPNKLVFNSLLALRDIYQNDRLTKTGAYAVMRADATARNVFNARNNGLIDRFMRRFEPTMVEQVDIFLEQLLIASRKSIPVDMTDRAKRLGMDIAGLLGFGYDLRLQTSDENYPILKAIGKSGFWAYVFFHCPSLRFWARPSTLLSAGSVIISRTSREKRAKRDLYSLVSDALDSEAGGVRQSDLWSDATFLGTNGDTVKTMLAATFFYLSRNPKCYEKLAYEIRSMFTSSREISGPTLASCQCLRACIDESLRMSPPTPGVFWREQVTDDSDNRPLTIDGCTIPRGVQVGVNTYSILHDEDVFPNPFTFAPERWLSSVSPEMAKLMSDAFIPFSIGPTQCAEKSMAYLGVSLIIAKTFWLFDFEQAPGELGKIGGGGPGMGQGRERSDEFQLYDRFTSGHKGPYLVFRTRGDLWKDIRA
ncbi:cytochrome P450 [Hypoxylon trugodes]|uniref:cytochrome P450 n=1 Tax=Hypoxylon trugodes TaxID=326681 RepID=UPI00219869FB|nr:cytochrome P450 [Hypoxylon trugodes]KAI1386173.1 cytochrome P450 [Hypoxylon trugodes]